MRLIASFTLLAGIATAWGQTQLTIYNQNFATVKERRVLDLKSGSNEVRVTDITAHLEPDSVVLRDIQQADAIRAASYVGSHKKSRAHARYFK
jgi:hypothetical protein